MIFYYRSRTWLPVDIGCPGIIHEYPYGHGVSIALGFLADDTWPSSVSIRIGSPVTEVIIIK